VEIVVTNRGKPTGDRRVRRTHATLQSALIQLVEQKDLSQVSVSDVVEAAGVSRSTFYDHYRDVHELAEAACTSMIDTLIESLPVLDPGLIETPENPEGSLLDFFTNLAEHAGLYRSLLGPQGSARVIDHIRRRITAAVYVAVRLADATDGEAPADTLSSSDIPHDVPAAFIAGSLVGVATDWLQRGCPRTPAEMAALTWPLLILSATPPRDISTAKA
jgi:AcrR family transcriptional regulator